MGASIAQIRSKKGLLGSINGQLSKGMHHKHGGSQFQQEGRGWKNAHCWGRREKTMAESMRVVCSSIGFPNMAKGKGERLLEAQAWRRGCVCMCEELYPSSFHQSFEELHSQRAKISPFSFTKTPFYKKTMIFMHVALIPTLLDQFSPFMCKRRACAAGFQCIPFRNYSRVLITYLNFN